MRKAYQLSLAILSSVILHTAHADFSFDPLAWHPGVGVDVGFMSQEFDAGFGDEQFKRDYPYTNFNFNLRFHRYFGVELGYQNQYNRQKMQWYPAQQPVLGFVNPGNTNQKLYISEVSGRGWNLSLLGFWPVCPKLGTELMGVAGVARLKMTYVTTVFEEDLAANPIASFDGGYTTLAKLGLGVKQPITDHFGARLLALWQNTSKLDSNFAVPFGQGGAVSPTSNADFYQVNPKNSVVVSLGLFFEL